LRQQFKPERLATNFIGFLVIRVQEPGTPAKHEWLSFGAPIVVARLWVLGFLFLSTLTTQKIKI